jgi:hypothetical protein
MKKEILDRTELIIIKNRNYTMWQGNSIPLFF